MISVFGMLAWLFYGIVGFLTFGWSLFCFFMWCKEQGEPKICDRPVPAFDWEADKARIAEQKDKERIIALKGGMDAIYFVNRWKRTRDWEKAKAVNPNADWHDFSTFGTPMDDFHKGMAETCIERMKANGVWQEEEDPI